MGSSRTGLDLEYTSRTKFCGLGLGLGLDDVVLEHIPVWIKNSNIVYLKLFSGEMIFEVFQPM